MGLTSSELVHLLKLVCLSQAFVLLGELKYTTDYCPPKPPTPHGCTAPSSANRNRLVRIPFLALVAYRWASNLKQMWFLWEVAVTGSIAWPPLSILNVDFEEMLWTLSMKLGTNV
jgi:hypothetical protein